MLRPHMTANTSAMISNILLSLYDSPHIVQYMLKENDIAAVMSLLVSCAHI